MLDPVLYGDETSAVVLLDLPASIEYGQQVPDSYTIKSSCALQHPYPSTEPKGPKRDAAVNAVPIDDRSYHAIVQRDVSSALAKILRLMEGQGQGAGSGSWCHRRGTLASPQDHESTQVLLLELASLGGSFSAQQSTDQVSAATVVPVVLSTTEQRTAFPSLQSLHANAICNPQLSIALVEVSQLGDFIIPPNSVFILASLASGLPAFQGAACTLLPPREPFWDLILMDPPWPNRSVRNSRAYTTSEYQNDDPFHQAVRIVRDFLAPDGVVAVWVTNKPSIRSGVLQALGDLHLSLFEEWVWIKTTTSGLPVTQLDGVWRRPYEVLLLFRKGQSGVVPPRRRVIAAVPDLHSRKPCLKILLDDLLPPGYTALELFARSLTAGWWSWGDEVLKFQHQSQWVDDHHH